jgi:hypothetical protein
MRNTLITIAAWTAAIAIVLWQRLLWPALKDFLPGIEDFFSPVRTNVVQAEGDAPTLVSSFEIETFVIEDSKPVRPRRVTRSKPSSRAAAGFAS